MAEKKQTATYESIMRDLKNRKFAPIYILQGDEPYFIDKICDYLAENVLKPEERDFNQVILFGGRPQSGDRQGESGHERQRKPTGTLF